MEEVWKNIEGYDDYQVSNLGRVKSTQYHNGTYERLLKPCKDKYCYLSVRLYKNGKGKMNKVHRLVAQAFLDNPDNLPFINHRDECKTNNVVENLEWCDRKYNNTYGSRNQRIADKLINGKESKTVYQYTLDGEFLAEYPSTMEVKRQLGYAQSNISRCCLGGRPTAYGYIWRYRQ